MVDTYTYLNTMIINIGTLLLNSNETHLHINYSGILMFYLRSALKTCYTTISSNPWLFL